jgi:hypothetical protein
MVVKARTLDDFQTKWRSVSSEIDKNGRPRDGNLHLQTVAKVPIAGLW